ncbi:unnamed protein product [Euphydryas editha]|uniref:Uncharacterized protein n=1 Tax=Euphydryas editha TaxID=104508 RepID=A0AAU9TVZ7_EUPED|nr:unnamed protein product [Euphydryas editha]
MSRGHVRDRGRVPTPPAPENPAVLRHSAPSNLGGGGTDRVRVPGLSGERPEKGGDEVGPEKGDDNSFVIDVSDASMRSGSPCESDSSGRFWKRRRCDTDDGASDADNDDARSKISTARRGRGRPPTAGQL